MVNAARQVESWHSGKPLHGNAPNPLFPGGLRGAELHARGRALQRIAALADAGHQGSGGRAGWPAVPPRTQQHAPYRPWGDDAPAPDAGAGRDRRRQGARAQLRQGRGYGAAHRVDVHHRPGPAAALPAGLSRSPSPRQPDGQRRQCPDHRGQSRQGRLRRGDLRPARRHRRSLPFASALRRAVRDRRRAGSCLRAAERRAPGRARQADLCQPHRMRVRRLCRRSLRPGRHRRHHGIPQRPRRLGAGDGTGGLGFTYIPEHSVTLAGLRVRPLVEPEITRQIQIVTVRGRPHVPAVGAFVNEALRFPWSSREPRRCRRAPSATRADIAGAARAARSC